MATEIKVGLAGFGNVGKGTYDILKRNHSLIRQRAGAPISVKRVTVRNVDRVKLLVDEDVIVTNDWHDLVNDPEVNVVVEAMGGIEPAKSLILAALKEKLKKRITVMFYNVCAFKRTTNLLRLIKDYSMLPGNLGMPSKPFCRSASVGM